MFNKTKPTRQDAAVPVPSDLPDLRSPQPAQSHGAPAQMAAPVRSAVPGKAASLLSADLVFEGNVSGGGDLHIDGTVRGDIKVARLTVGETGNVEGSVSADYVEVRGRIVGGVNGKQVKLMSTAYVDGDISHEQLSIDVGAYFQGRCLQGRPGAAQAAPAPQPNVGFAAPSYGMQPQPAPAPVAAQAPDTGQLIELKPSA